MGPPQVCHDVVAGADGLVVHGPWYVVEWDPFWAVDKPFPCTVPGGRHYAHVVV